MHRKMSRHIYKKALIEFQPDMALTAVFLRLWKQKSNFESSVLENAAFLVHHLHTPVCSQSTTAGINERALQQLFEQCPILFVCEEAQIVVPLI